jgi:RNA recognition motif-containing protein
MNIFISNLNFKVQSEDLNEIFAEYGDVTSAKVIMDKFSGRSRGFGFVEMEDETAGRKAIEELDGAEYVGKTISVSIARPKTENRDNNRDSRREYGNNSRSSFRNRY